jgi:hypothetical protein
MLINFHPENAFQQNAGQFFDPPPDFKKAIKKVVENYFFHIFLSYPRKFVLDLVLREKLLLCHLCEKEVVDEILVLVGELLTQGQSNDLPYEFPSAKNTFLFEPERTENRYFRI